MKSCLTCGRDIADSANVCEPCEAWAAALVEERPADDEAHTSQGSTGEGHPPVAAATPPVAVAAATPAAAEPATGSRRQVPFAAAAVAAVALTGFAISARGGSAPEASAVAAAPAAHLTPVPPSAPAVAATAVQTWRPEASWLDNRRRGAAFELRSENIVKTSFGPARPTLVIRCISQSIEAFVIAGSPMRIDPRVEGKMVTIGMDGEPVRTEHWANSDDRTGVFAPDPAAFTQRLRAARMLHFGYSPHNSSDVVAQFHVFGIDGVIDAASKHCGATK